MVARSPEAMASFLGATEANIMLASSDIGQNGDDAIELFYNGEVIETFGDVDTDGTGRDAASSAWTDGDDDETGDARATVGARRARERVVDERWAGAMGSRDADAVIRRRSRAFTYSSKTTASITSFI